MKKLVNLTPHPITLILPSGESMVIEPSGLLARVSAHTEVCGGIGVIPITRTVYGDIEGLPEPNNKEIYIVSSLVAQRCPDRDDIFIPNESVRDEQGRIIGCKSLGRVH